MNSNEPKEPDRREVPASVHLGPGTPLLLRLLLETEEGEIRPPLPPELREWALQQATDQDHFAGLKELQEKGGTELSEVIQRLKQRRNDCGTTTHL